MVIGHARVLQVDQKPEFQTEAFPDAACTEAFTGVQAKPINLYLMPSQ